MGEIPAWFEAAYQDLATVRAGELLEEPIPSLEDSFAEFSKKVGVILPNVLAYGGTPIESDEQVPTPVWVCNLLGDHASRFSTLPARAAKALEDNLANRRAQQKQRNTSLAGIGLPAVVQDTKWLLNATMTNFANNFNPEVLDQTQAAFATDYFAWKLPIASSLSSWPLQVRTNADVHRDFQGSLQELGLQEAFEALTRMTFPNELGSNFNNGAQATLFPVMLNMLRKGYSLYPTLTA